MEGQIAKIIIPMLKNQTVNTKQHEFILSKISPSSLECILLSDFRPTQKPDQPFECITPRFNQDAAYFTPAFTLPIDQKFYRENANFERLKFDERIQNASERPIVKNNYNFLPPPNYCQLCKTSFQDYLEHTHSQQHSQQITASIANHFIQELAGQFKPACRKTKRIGRKKVEEKRMERPPKRSCKMSGSNINNIAAKRGVSDAKNSNHSTNLISSSG